MPTATTRSARRRVRRNVRTARSVSSPKSASPTTRSVTASRLPGAGTLGTALGTSMPTAPRASTPASSTTCKTSSGLMSLGRRRAGRADSASTAAPTGSVAPPVKATTPFMPIRTPGVAMPCSARSAAMTENAVPTRIVRLSRRFAPANVRASAATAAASAVRPTPLKCTCGPNITCRCARKESAPNGSTPISAPRARPRSSVLLRRMLGRESVARLALPSLEGVMSRRPELGRSRR